MIWTRECPDTAKASDTVDTKALVKSRPSVNSVSVPTYVNCAGFHHLAACDDFLSKLLAQRSVLVKKKQVCFNCLRSNHYTSKCSSKLRYVHCHRKHHSLLHPAAATVPTPVNQAPEIDDSSRTVSTTSPATVANVQNAQAEAVPVQVLLATVWVDLHTTEDWRFKVRALLDQGSTLSFIFKSLCQTLRTKRQRADLQIRCFGDNFTGLARSKVSLRLGPCTKPGPTFPFTAYVFQRITTYALQLTGSVFSLMAISTWSQTGGSQSRKSTANPFTNRGRSIRIAIDERSSPRSIGHAYGPKDSTRLDHIRSYGFRSTQYEWPKYHTRYLRRRH